MCHVLFKFTGYQYKIHMYNIWQILQQNKWRKRKFDEIIHTLQSNALLSRPTGLKLGYRHTYGPWRNHIQLRPATANFLGLLLYLQRSESYPMTVIWLVFHSSRLLENCYIFNNLWYSKYYAYYFIYKARFLSLTTYNFIVAACTIFDPVAHRCPINTRTITTREITRGASC